MMAFDENAVPVTQNGERMPQKPAVINSIPLDQGARSVIPFGIDGTLVIISPCGEVLRMSKYIAEDNPRVICLNSSELEVGPYGLHNRMERLARFRDTGFGIRLLADAKLKHPIKTQLEWINGRWPCIHYEIDGVLVSVLFTVIEGVLSQQYFIENPSSKIKAVRFGLQIQPATVGTLRLVQGQWASSQDSDQMESLFRPDASGHYVWVEGERERGLDEPLRHDGDTVTAKGEALIAIFSNDKLLKLDEKVSVPIRRFYELDSDDEYSNDADDDTRSASDQKVPSASSGVLQIAPKGIEKLVLQYKLQSHSDKEPQSPRYLEVETFLKSEQSKGWSSRENHKFNLIFKRYLEHILCLCLVEITPEPGEERCIPFMNDATLESESTALGDL